MDLFSKRSVPQSAGPIIDDLESMLLSMTHGLGDGLVTLASARLEGVPLVTVSGNHLSMIRNISESNSRIPPAISVILNRLENH